MIPQNFNDSRLINSTTMAEMSDQAKIFYYMAAQEVQKHITNSIIANRNIDFYLKRSFDLDPTISYYNFYKETDVTKLKVFIENFLKYIPDRQSKSKDESEFKAPEDLKITKKLNQIEFDLKNTIYSAKLSRSSEIEALNEVLKNVKNSNNVAKLKTDLDFFAGEYENLISKLEQILAEVQNIGKFSSSPSKFKSKDHNDEPNDNFAKTEKFPPSIASRRMTKCLVESSAQTGDYFTTELDEIFRLAPSSESRVIKRVLGILKGTDKDSATDLLRKRQTLDNEEIRLNLMREKDRIEILLKERNEEISYLKRQFHEEKEELERELVEKDAELSLQRQIHHSDKEGLEKVLMLKTEDLEKIRKQHNSEKEKLFDQIANLKRETEDKNMHLDTLIKQLNNEKEENLKRIKEINENFAYQKSSFLEQIKEKEKEYEKNKAMIMSLFKEKCDEWEKNTENLTKKMKEKYDEIELSKENLKKELANRESEFESMKNFYEQLIIEKNDEIQEHKEILLREIQESNSYKEKLNSIILENLDINKKMIHVIKEKEEIEALFQESAQRHKTDQESLIKELAGFELKQEKDLRETTSKNAELEAAILKIKKQNEQLKSDNIKLVEALEIEKKRKEVIGALQDPDTYKKSKTSEGLRGSSIGKQIS